MNQEKAKKLLSALTTAEDRSSGIFSALEKELQSFGQRMKETINLKTVQQVEDELKRFQKNLKPLKQGIDDLKNSLNEKEKSLKDLLSTKIDKLNGLINDAREFTNEKHAELLVEIDDLQGEIKNISSIQKENLNSLTFALAEYDDSLNGLSGRIKTLEGKKEKDWADEIKNVEDSVSKLRDEIVRRFSMISHGGNANRNIAVGGNSSVLSRYTDINLKAGANITLTYSNNNTTKYLDLTIAATGGSGGTVRSINAISTSQTAGATAGTDYVYIASTGLALTLPTAAGNQNLYTVKNTSTSSILVATTGGETIDTSSNAILPTQYTAIDLISDGTNWNIT